MNISFGAKRAGASPVGWRKRHLAGLVAVAFVAASCGVIPGAESASVRAEPANESDTSANPDNNANNNTDPADPGVDDPEDRPGEQNDSDGRTKEGQAGSSLGDGIIVQRYTVPYVPPISLPDVSVLSETGAIVKTALGDLAGQSSGLDVVGADCAADGGELVYSGSDEAGSFFDVEGDGSGTYELVHGDNGNVDITINPDGSGSYELVHGREGNISIQVNADGSGSYDHVHSDNGNVDIVVEADGSGKYDRIHGDDGNVEIEINADGSGSYKHFASDNGNIETVVNNDGTGSYTHVHSDQGNIEIEVGNDGSRRYKQIHGPNGNVEIEINADGSGRFEHFASDDGNVKITVDSNGNGVYEHVHGSNGDVKTDFTTDIGILDPELLVVGPEPTFSVADRFPPLAKLASLRPPCVTIIRLDANVLFDFDSDQLRPEAEPVVDKVAAALIANGKPLDVHGHTDSKGDDAYNQDLSERRAASFAQALTARGVTSEITTVGYGETRPAAANETPDGADDPAGRQLNRRIEIVIPE